MLVGSKCIQSTESVLQAQELILYSVLGMEDIAQYAGIRELLDFMTPTSLQEAKGTKVDKKPIWNLI